MNLRQLLLLVGAGTTLVKSLTINELRKNMGLGVNLGNTFDFKKDWSETVIKDENAPLWPDSEVTVKEAIEGYKQLGFNSIRIPVRWYTSSTPSTKTPIEPNLFKSVDTVVRTIIDNDMYVVINLETNNYYMNGFISEDEDVKSETYDSYKGTWKAIADYFKDYDEHLLFESMNEVGFWDSVWSSRTGEGDRQKAYDILRQVNQEFVNAVRSSDSYNAERWLLIEGYASDPILSQDHFLKITSDPVVKVIVSMYYYEPIEFTVIDKYANWGTIDDKKQLNKIINDLRYRYVIQNVPVIITKYGTLIRNRSIDMVSNYITSVANATTSQEIPSFLADHGDFIDRSQTPLSFIDESLEEKFKEMGKRFNPPSSEVTEEITEEATGTEEEVCWSLEEGYPCCSSSTTKVSYTDEQGEWGVENGQWCGLPK